MNCPFCKKQLFPFMLVHPIDRYKCKCPFVLEYDKIMNKIHFYSIDLQIYENILNLNSYIVNNQTNILNIKNNYKRVINIKKFLPPNNSSNLDDYLNIANKLLNLNVFS